jgi:hypothetical protein
LVYKKLSGNTILEVHSDAGFKKEVDSDGHCDGKAIRGANFLRRESTIGRGQVGNPVHLLDWIVGMIKQVTRSTFTSEAGALLLAADQAIVLRTTLHEVQHGRIKLHSSADSMLEGGSLSSNLIVLVTDALNIFLALDTPNIKPPAEK